MFLQYAVETGYNLNVETAKNSFSDFVNEALSKQKTIIESLEAKEIDVINFSSELLEMLDSKTILIGSKGDDCFIRSNHLYITNKAFGVCLKNKFGRTFSAKEVTAYFRNRYISEAYADNRLKKYNNKCYLVLNIKELVKDARDDSHTIDNLFFE